MMNSFICGISHLPEEEHDIDELLSPCSKSTPKKHKKSKDSKNPYANRGLDKFYTLLDELESKKQKIYTQKGSEDISFVRFVYSSSNDWKPIVVKAKDRKQHDQNHGKTKSVTRANSQEKDKRVMEGLAHVQESKGEIMNQRNQQMISGRSRLSFKMEILRQPSWYVPVMIVLILLFLVIYGRTFAVLCSSIGWYLVPIIKESRSSSSLNWSQGLDRPERKKGYGRNLSEKNIATKESTSPKSVLSGSAEKSLVRHTHRKSW